MLADGNQAIDMRGLHDTRAIDATGDEYSNTSTLRTLLEFLQEKGIDTIHGVQWHIFPTTRVSETLSFEAQFINGLVGEYGWRNVVVLCLGFLSPGENDIVPQEIPIREVITRFTRGYIPPIRGLLLNIPFSATDSRNIGIFIDNPLENAEVLSRLRESYTPIKVRTLLLVHCR